MARHDYWQWARRGNRLWRGRRIFRRAGARAREHGLYENPSRRLDAAMTSLSTFLTQTLVLVTAALLCGLAAGLWADAIMRRRINKSPDPQSSRSNNIEDEEGAQIGKSANLSDWNKDHLSSSHFPEGLHICSINLSSEHLADDLYIQISVHGINATGETIALDRIDGFVQYRERIEVSFPDPIDLPPATIIKHLSRPDLSGHLQEFSIIIHQPFRSALAKRASDLLDEGQMIGLYFQSWNVMARIAGAPERSARLPLWDGASLVKRPYLFMTGKLAVLRGLHIP